MIQFEISTLAETLAEGGAYSFTVTPKAALSADVTIHWVIVPKGKIPITKNDFAHSYLEGTVVRFASGDTAAQTVTITPTDDTRPEVSGEFEIQIYQVVADGDNILLASQDVTLTDDDDFSGVPTSTLPGDSNANNFFFGGSSVLRSEGGSDNDAYVISRYQTDDVDLTDGFGGNIIKFDYGVEIVAVNRNGYFNENDAELTLGTGGIVTWANPDIDTNWQYQIGDGDVLGWTEFLEELGLGSSGGTLTTPYRVASFASDTVTGGNIASEFLGSRADEVFSFGGDGWFGAYGREGDDIYIITRYQSDDVTLTDTDGTNIIKLDYGVEISAVRERRDGRGELRLGTDASVTWANPTNPANWQYQIGDDVVLDWSEFLTKLGLIDVENVEDTGDSEAIDDRGGELVNPYTVDFLPDITTNGGNSFTVPMGERSYVDTIVAIDGDGDDLIFSLSGTRANLFEIDASGELRFRAKPDTDYKYELMVYVTDGSYDASGNPRGATEDTFEHRDAGRTFKYTGGELSKTDDGVVSVAAGTITKVGGATFNFAAQTGLDVEGEVDSYIIVDDDDSDGTYEARRVEELPTGDDYYALGNVVSNTLTTYGYDYNDMINVQVDVSITDVA